MSMMVSPVSNVRFCGEADAANILGRPGKYSASDAAQSNSSAAAPADGTPKKKSHKLLKTVIGLIVAAGVLAALPKVFPNAIKALDAETLKNATKGQKVGHYFAKIGEGIAKYTYKPILNLFKKKETQKEAASLIA